MNLPRGLPIAPILLLMACRPAQGVNHEPTARVQPCPDEEDGESLAEIRRRRIREEVEGAFLGDGAVGDALQTCKYLRIEDEDVRKLCRELFKRSIDGERRELEAVRDAGGDGLGKCFDLQATADMVSPEARASADVLCKEAEAGKRAREALDEVKRRLGDGTLEVPFQCSMAVEDLEKLSSEWARTRLQDVLMGCYVELGRKILPARVKKMLICEYQVEQVYRAVKKFNLRDAVLDPWIARADAKCSDEE